MPALKELTIELCQKCFQSCLYCSSNSSVKDGTKLSFEVVKQVLNDFSILGGGVVELSGGEPLSYERIHEVIEYASRKRLEIHLFTCAYLPNEEIDFAKLSKIDRFYVNLQAPSKIIHDHLANSPGSFERAIKFINDCKAMGKWIGTHLVPLVPNIDEISEYFELAKHLKLDNVSLLRFVRQGRGRKNRLTLNDDEILHLFSIIEKYREVDALNLKVGCPLDFGFAYKKGRTATRCESGIGRCVIRPNGNVIPCPAFKDTIEFVAGNVNERSLVDIWKNSSVFESLRNFDHKKLSGLCRDCSFIDICKGRCHAQRWHRYGNLYQGPDPYCPLKLITNS